MYIGCSWGADDLGAIKKRIDQNRWWQVLSEDGALIPDEAAVRTAEGACFALLVFLFILTRCSPHGHTGIPRLSYPFLHLVHTASQAKFSLHHAPAYRTLDRRCPSAGQDSTPKELRPHSGHSTTFPLLQNRNCLLECVYRCNIFPSRPVYRFKDIMNRVIGRNPP